MASRSRNPRTSTPAHEKLKRDLNLGAQDDITDLGAPLYPGEGCTLETYETTRGRRYRAVGKCDKDLQHAVSEANVHAYAARRLERMAEERAMAALLKANGMEGPLPLFGAAPSRTGSKKKGGKKDAPASATVTPGDPMLATIMSLMLTK